MKKRIKLATVLPVCVLLLVSLFCGCRGRAETDVASSSQPESTEQSSSEPISVPESSSEPANASEPEIDARIVFRDEDAEISGAGATFSDGVLTVSEGGVYAVGGSTENGRILVDAPDADVTLCLTGANLSNPDGCALYVYDAASVTLQLADGTENALEDAKDYRFNGTHESGEDEEPNACVYAKANLIINGGGSLTVRARYKNGVTCKDALVVEDASVSVEAKKHGVTGKDSLTVQDATLNVTAGGDAVRSTNDEDENCGWVKIENAALNLVSGEDGVQAETALTLNKVECVLTSGGGANGTPDEDQSAKGFKAGTQLCIKDGKYDMNCLDDAIHSDGDVLISGGSLLIATGDDGVHADGNAVISGGNVTVSQCYEGIEGKTVVISGGAIDILSEDDGINAAGDADVRTGEAQPGVCITISGGVIRIDAEGDGVDSNGDLIVTGGELYVSGPSRDGNAALDYDGEAFITGGVVIAAGPSGMAQNFGSNSSQGSILARLDSRQTGEILLTDANGNVLASWTVEKEFDCAVVSCPEIKSGGTYTLRAGESEQEIAMNGLIYGEGFHMGGGFGGGMRRP